MKTNKDKTQKQSPTAAKNYVAICIACGQEWKMTKETANKIEKDAEKVYMWLERKGSPQDQDATAKAVGLTVKRVHQLVALKPSLFKYENDAKLAVRPRAQVIIQHVSFHSRGGKPEMGRPILVK
jgi:hypothetical protein